MIGPTTAASSGCLTGDRESFGGSPRPGRTFEVDLPGLASAFGQRLHEAGMPVTPNQSVQYATALQLTKPGSRQRLYVLTRAIFVTDLQQVATFDLVFLEVFGAHGETNADELEPTTPATHL
jgi:uncharacterized protein with von Willebrand factor type A (vWA) domain